MAAKRLMQIQQRISFWTVNPPHGRYVVKVAYFENCPPSVEPTNFVLRIRNGNSEALHNGIVGLQGQVVTVAEFLVS